MRILNMSKIDSEYPKRCECENCGAELEYDREDQYVGIYGINFVKCPNCGDEVDITNKDTKRTIKMTWNTTFNHTCSDSAIDISDERIQEMIDRTCAELKGEDVGYYFTMATGNTLVIGVKNPDSTTVYVTKDYYEDVIFKE